MTQPAALSRFSCPGCSAALRYDPAANGLKCDYCGRVEPVPATVAGERAHLREVPYESAASAVQKITPQALEVTCTGCGVVVAFEPPTVAGVCSFCGAALVAQPKAADPLVCPQAVLPFKLSTHQANQGLKDWLASRWFAPNGLAQLAQKEGLTGIYVPFWTFDAETDSRYTGQRGDAYYTTESYTTQENGRTVTRQRQVRHIRWSHASGRVLVPFDDVIVEACTSVDQQKLRELAPWDLRLLEPYQEAFLAGFRASRYQVDLNQGLGIAKQRMEPVIAAAIGRDIGGDEQQIHSVDTDYSAITFRHVLLPVWMGAYRFQGKVFQILVNAQTGEVQGDRPYSAAKIAFLVIVILLAVAILILLNQ